MKRKLLAIAAALGIVATTTGCPEGGEEDEEGPSVTVTSQIADDYEGYTTVGLTITDESALGTTEVQYREDGASGPYTSVAVPPTGGSVALPSDVLEARVRATDEHGNQTLTPLTSPIEVYATNADGLAEIEAKLVAYKAGGLIHEWYKDMVFDNGTPAENVTAEYVVHVKNPSDPANPDAGWLVPVFYDGEGETAASGALYDAIQGLQNNHGMADVVVIGPAAEDRIPGLMDDALAVDFGGGTYKSIGTPEESMHDQAIKEIF